MSGRSEGNKGRNSFEVCGGVHSAADAVEAGASLCLITLMIDLPNLSSLQWDIRERCRVQMERLFLGCGG
jgi:hypothetical protein